MTAHFEVLPMSVRFQFGRGVATLWAWAFLLGIFFLQPAVAEVTADLVWVRKSERTLHLLRNYDIIASYPIALGKQPIGHKLAAGDSRTPEGLYRIDWRNPDSEFYLSLHISYPNRSDLRRAVAEGVSAGGNIMIHGRADDTADAWSQPGEDWTDGCIALSNRDMRRVWRLVFDDTPIVIDP